MSESYTFLSGIIEGFYGPPWTLSERLELFRWMRAGGLNTYLYGPKDDLKHRALWRESYSPEEAASLEGLIQSCHQHGLQFIYALGPGLDLRYTHAPDIDCLKERFAQMLRLGCRNFSLLFDDIPDRLDPVDRNRWGSFAAAQSGITNEIFAWLRAQCPSLRFFFCPTPYCGRMALRQLGGPGYLETIGRELAPEIDIFWTGPEIIAREITVEHIADVRAQLRRPPVIWDNLHANDYDGRRFFCGPYTGRPTALKQNVRGILANPNVEFPLNYVPIRVLAEYLRSGATDPRATYLSALRAWFSEFTTVHQPLAFEDLVLFGDCYYLPYEQGPEAIQLLNRLRDVVTSDPTHWGDRATAIRADVVRLRDFCARLTELRNRPLFHALSRRVWELREELDLFDRFLTFKSMPENRDRPFVSDFHLPKTYRGGLVPQLQQLLVPRGGESLAPAN